MTTLMQMSLWVNNIAYDIKTLRFFRIVSFIISLVLDLHRTHAHQLYLYDCGPYIPWQSYQKRSRGGRINEYPCACHGSCAPVPPIL